VASVARQRPRPASGGLADLGESLRQLDLPFSLRLYGMTEEVFDELTDEDTRVDLLDGVMIAHSPASPRHDNLAGFLRVPSRALTGFWINASWLWSDPLPKLLPCLRRILR
jgi:hypothetical protein